MSVADERNTLLDARDISRALQRMAKEVVDFAGGTDRLVLVGIQRRGVDLAQRLGTLIGADVPRGELDITLYRDDLQTIGPAPVVGKTDLHMDVTDRCVMIVDDVLYTGRTIRAALSVLGDFGRPSRIGLCVLIDRGDRELPIQADIVGETVDARHDDRVDVLLEERDGEDAVVLVRRPEE
jgi:pyrimidine operon attenuation protein/uracil phosphoribosyltransferase